MEGRGKNRYSRADFINDKTDLEEAIELHVPVQRSPLRWFPIKIGITRETELSETLPPIRISLRSTRKKYGIV